MSRTIDRPGQAEVVEDFLAAARSGSAALIIEGEAGIGKTTVWLSATEVAARRGFQVLVARPSAAESVLAYGSLADMLGGVDPGMWEHLPAPQRAALERVLLRADGTGPVDQRAVAAGFRSVVDALAGAGPVLLAIDDLQWLDTSSRLVIEFAARRMPAGVGYPFEGDEVAEHLLAVLEAAARDFVGADRRDRVVDLDLEPVDRGREAG